LLVGSLFAFTGAAHAQGCNVVNVETVIPPDNFSQTVYVHLASDQGGGVITECTASFVYPPSGETDTVNEKCQMLVNAVAAQCGPPFGTVDDCAANAKFQVFDANFLATMSLGISNNAAVFTQTGAGQAIPDYEGDRIVNSCGGPNFGSDGAFAGVANGVKIREENPTSGIIVFLDLVSIDTMNQPPNPPVFLHRFQSSVESQPGDSATTLVATAVADLQSQIAADPNFGSLVSVAQNGQRLEARSLVGGIGVGAIMMSNDGGITSGTTGGSMAGLDALTAPPIGTPAVGVYGLALLALLLLLSGWIGLHYRGRRGLEA